MRLVFALFVLLQASQVLAADPVLRCERRHPQERVVAKAFNSTADAFSLIGRGEILIYDYLDQVIDRHAFAVNVELAPDQEVAVFQPTLNNSDRVAYCVFKVNAPARR